MKKALKRGKQPVAIAQTIPPPSKPTLLRHLLCVAVLWGLALAAYSNSFHGALVFDSALVIRDDSRIHAATADNVRLILTGYYWSNTPGAALYRPLTSLSYLFNYALLGNGSTPEGYHWVNFTLHCLNILLVYLLGLLIFQEAALAMSFATLWAVHPLLTESVTNVVGRADLLAACGVLAGLLCYLRFITNPSSGQGTGAGWLAALIGAQMLGLFSKENAIVLPAIMLFYDALWPERASLRKRLPAYGTLALVLAAFFYLRHGLAMHLTIDFAENPLAAANFLSARLTAVKVIGKFLWMFLWPARLSADYSYAAIPAVSWHPDWENFKAIFALVVCLAALALAFKLRRSNRPLSFFTGFFFIALLPTSNLLILIGSVMAERFIYLPLVGAAGWAVAAAYWLLRRSLGTVRAERATLAFAGAAALILAAVTHARNSVWQDELSLWTDAVAAYPESARPHNNLGMALSQIPGRLPDAAAEFRSALRIRPDYALAHYNLATALLTMQNVPDAVPEFEAAARLAPDLWQAHYNLGNALAGLPNRLPDAIREFETALRLKPDLAEAHDDLGRALQASGRPMEAIAELQIALRYRPNDADTHYNLGTALASIPGRLPEASVELETAVRIRPYRAEARYELARALVRIPGREKDAAAEFDTAFRLMPDMEEQERFNALLRHKGER